MTYSRNDDHASQALARLLTQLRGKPNVAALLTTYLTQVQEIEAVFDVLYNQRGVDSPIGGVVYDGLGQIVGLPRNGLTDIQYMTRINAQIVVNNSSGTIQDLIDAVQFVTSPIVTEEGNAAIRVESPTPIADLTVPILVQLLGAAKAAGVRLTLQYPGVIAAPPFFSFGPDPDIGGDSAGFDIGAFVAAVEVLP